MPDDITAIGGTAGMGALLSAFDRARDKFELTVVSALPIDGSREAMLLFTIGETTAALTFVEASTLAAVLIDGSRAGGHLEQFGRVLNEALAHVPGQHGAH